MEKLSKLLLCLILVVTFAVSFIPHSPTRAQVEEQQPKDEAKDDPQKIAPKAVIAVVCRPERLAEEIHKLNKQGLSVSKDDVQVVGDKVMIFIMAGTESQEER